MGCLPGNFIELVQIAPLGDPLFLQLTMQKLQYEKHGSLYLYSIGRTLIMGKNSIKVALIGNPNVGKTSVFNLLTSLNQQVGNYPGITVDKKMGLLN